jgi:hypothetical protein
MDHSTKTWRYDPPTPKPPRKGVRLLIVVVLYALATGAMVLIAGGR